MQAIKFSKIFINIYENFLQKEKYSKISYKKTILFKFLIEIFENFFEIFENFL